MIQDFIDNKFYLLLYFISIIYAHIFADYHLQGILINLKHRSYWDDITEYLDEESKDFYINDYRCPLSAHAFEWSLFIHLPILFIIFKYNIDIEMWIFLVSFIFNYITHKIVDDKRVNEYTINFSNSHYFHLFQCIDTGILWLFVFINK